MACTVKELQSFLIERGVVVGGQMKLELAQLCEIAREINLQVDPDGLIEDRNDVIDEKIQDGEPLCRIPHLQQARKTCRCCHTLMLWTCFRAC